MLWALWDWFWHYDHKKLERLRSEIMYASWVTIFIALFASNLGMEFIAFVILIMGVCYDNDNIDR